jgi:hypothetical protein
VTKFADPIAWESTLPIRPSSPAWRVTIKALYGSTLTDDEIDLFRELSGGREPSPGGDLDLLAVAGRRGGKSEEIARVGVFEAVHGGHAAALAPGQIGVFAIVAPLREQAQEILRYAVGLAELPQVKRQLARVTSDTVEFKTGVAVQVMTCDSVAVIGRTLLGAVAEEFARWPDDSSATPDRAIIDSLRPGLAPVRGAPPRRFIGITSAYLKEGVAFELEQANFGRPDAHTLVVRGTTQVFNPNIDRAWLERERARVGDLVYRREYECEWQDAVTDGFFANVLERSIDRGRKQSNPRDGVQYVIALDPAFKSDQFGLAIAHREVRGDGEMPVIVVDGVHAWIPKPGAPLSPAEVMQDVHRVCEAYGVHHVYADQHDASSLHDLAMLSTGLHVVEIPWNAGLGENSKAARYRRVQSLMASGLVRLPDDRDTRREFAAISTRLLRSGGEQIQARSGHDDRVSACVLAITKAQDLYPSFPPIRGGSGNGHNPFNWGSGAWTSE